MPSSPIRSATAKVALRDIPTGIPFRLVGRVGRRLECESMVTEWITGKVTMVAVVWDNGSRDMVEESTVVDVFDPAGEAAKRSDDLRETLARALEMAERLQAQVTEARNIIHAGVLLVQSDRGLERDAPHLHKWSRDAIARMGAM